MRILFYCWKAYNQADIISALRRRGHTVDTFELELGNFEVDENFTGRFIDKLFNGEENTACSNVPEAKEHEGNECRTAEKLGSVYDAVFSVNYFPIISEASSIYAGRATAHCPRCIISPSLTNVTTYLYLISSAIWNLRSVERMCSIFRLRLL